MARSVCGEFEYRAGSWARPRRVCCCSEMPEGELLPRTFFVVTDMEARPSDVIAFYRQRGAMELVIGELKEGYLCNCVQSRSMAANEFRCLLGVLAYRLANWLRLLALPERMRPERTTTLRASVLKIAAKRVRHGRRTLFRMPSSCPHKAAVVGALRAAHYIAHALEPRRRPPPERLSRTSNACLDPRQRGWLRTPRRARIRRSAAPFCRLGDWETPLEGRFSVEPSAQPRKTAPNPVDHPVSASIFLQVE